jgi:hypothetical protein
MHYGDIRLGDTIDIKFTTRQISGAPFTLAGSPVISAYVGNSTTEITAGITLSVDFDSRTGLNNVRVVASSGNGFATATNVQLVITTGTVNGVSVVGEVVGSFSIEARSALMPTTAARTLDVSSTGEAGLDWANVGSPTTALALTGTTIATTQKVDVETIKTQAVTAAAGVTFPTSIASPTNIAAGTITTVTNLTNAPTNGDLTATMKTSVTTAATAATPTAAAVTGAVGSVTGNVGGNVTGSVGSVVGAVGSVTGNVGGNVTGSVGSVVATVAANLTQILGTALTETAGQIAAAFKKFFNIAAPAATMDHLVLVDTVTTYTGNTPQTGDAFARLGAPAGASVSADIAAVQSDTNDIQTRLPAALVGGRIDASVGAMAADVLTSTALAASAVTEIQTGLATSAAQVTAQATLTKLDTTVEVQTGGVYRFTQIALELAPSGGGGITVQQIVDGVWDEPIAGHLGAGTTGAALNGAGSAGDPWTTPLPGAYGAGTAGFIVGTNLDAQVSAVKAKTDNLPTDPADESLVIAATDAIFNRIGAPAGASVSADIAAVQSDTNDIQTRLPAALVSGRMDANVGAMAANVLTAAATAADFTTEIQTGLATAASLATTDGKVDAIKAKTDNLPSDPADQSLVIAATDAVMARLGAPAGASVSADIAAVKVDTAAVKAKTDNLPSDPADASVIAGRFDTVDTNVAAVKAKTDSLAFTVAGQVDANVQYVNDAAVTGNGQPGTEWGPA